jgi:hypothetical protein
MLKAIGEESKKLTLCAWFKSVHQNRNLHREFGYIMKKVLHFPKSSLPATSYFFHLKDEA